MKTRDDAGSDARRAEHARLATLAAHVFGSDAAGQEWMAAPHPLFGGRTPLEVAATPAGARCVEAVLQRLGHGLPVS